MISLFIDGHCSFLGMQLTVLHLTPFILRAWHSRTVASCFLTTAALLTKSDRDLGGLVMSPSVSSLRLLAADRGGKLKFDSFPDFWSADYPRNQAVLWFPNSPSVRFQTWRLSSYISCISAVHNTAVLHSWPR